MNGVTMAVQLPSSKVQNPGVRKKNSLGYALLDGEKDDDSDRDGEDGYEVAKAFVDAMPMVGYRGVLLAGPFMPTSQFENLQALA